MYDLLTWLRVQFETERQARALLSPSVSSKFLEETLAEVDAKRRILDEHAPTPKGMGQRPDLSYGEMGPVCRRCGTPDKYGEMWPCLTVRLLALPYADRPGYRDEWRP